MYLLISMLLLAQPPAPTLDALLEKLVEQRAALEAARKAEAATVLEIQKRYKELTDKLAALGITPGPGPKPVPPPDSLKAKIQAAFDADAEPIAEKREHAKDLAALYREAGKLAVNPAIATAGELVDKVRGAAMTLVGPKALVAVRTAVASELGQIFPFDAPLTGDQRAAAAALFARLAEILDGL